jgi:cholesterol transport system auxiliary component
MKTTKIAGRSSGGWEVLALLVLLGGCATLLPAPPPEPSLHLLAATAPVAPYAPETARRDVVLEVAVPRAAPGFDTPRMAYVQKPYELDYFVAHRWAEAPARMLAPLLTQALERSGGFRAVVQAPTAVPADVRLSTEIVRLQQDFSVRPSRVEFVLRVQLVDVRARRVMATRSFDETAEAPSEDAAGGVTAANAALSRVLAQLVDFCAAETAQGAPSSR